MINDSSAQANMLEVVMVAAMLFATLFFVQSLHSVAYEETHEKNILKEKGYSALTSLDSYPYEKYSLLEKYIKHNETGNFTNFIYARIFPSMAYNVYIYNISMMFSNSGANATAYKTTWQRLDAPKVGEIQQAHRLFVSDGYVYEIVLEMWYI